MVLIWLVSHHGCCGLHPFDISFLSWGFSVLELALGFGVAFSEAWNRSATISLCIVSTSVVMMFGRFLQVSSVELDISFWQRGPDQFVQAAEIAKIYCRNFLVLQ